MIEQEKNFNILQNESGNLLFLVKSRKDEPVDPVIVYDGGEHALLYRNNNNTVILDDIHPAVRKTLRRKKQVLVVETNNGNIVHEYIANVSTLKKNPNPGRNRK